MVQLLRFLNEYFLFFADFILIRHYFSVLTASDGVYTQSKLLLDCNFSIFDFLNFNWKR